MVNAFILSLICGPVGVTFGCWLFFAIAAAQSHNEAVVCVLVDRSARNRPRAPR